MKWINLQAIFSFCLLFFCTISCGEHKSTVTNGNVLNIATAANVQFAMEDIKVAFEQKHAVKINVIIGSSGKLTAQIIQGAPYDLLISANLKYPLHLYQEKFAAKPPQIYALGSLVLWTFDKTIKLEKSLEFLKQKGINKIAIANPKNAPYGAESVNALAYLGLEKSLSSKLVFAENIAQTNLYVSTRNCEVGFTAKSVVLAKNADINGQWMDVPSIAYKPIEQGIIMTKHGASKNKEMAQKFYDFMFSEDAQNILKKYGYSMPVKS